ncbi:hypothetical protein GLOIN_2v1712165 [Rhizophagus irregularis DAOM 181602=DAOM 197198]|uniref:Uncharacterized protein n=1 Tax=Rhizophagus irregularis (strain DAOM 181602 / DAOM 197198 / MUCL 43194) TaxID=747089 RepID=A0A2P4P582_RHIID|nr:hypothetical protein GLOIN_2v1712165 [Rhizophagus irregularis DAOM 181602=DAOM 197198]POG60549.1 hypothetical protein GLOIN_2v1712165 [Rhizophagus irregularis DAOM 181602=DAOM 197198]GET65664.1 hypothetical protein GLOIN_2v1712165 [Rhizophagus irregularis DAOM 181602=DAOM 197198]|eukprot:XP_025167415.1 hypothetical protein GLOIN_2v1712165 [Rhizophagus irregularis DAOM 181602=DAOM 197198]
MNFEKDFKCNISFYCLIPYQTYCTLAIIRRNKYNPIIRSQITNIKYTLKKKKFYIFKI